jgi:hypothetical protein
LPFTADGREPKPEYDGQAHAKVGFHIFPATAWQSVFATDFALSSSNP